MSLPALRAALEVALAAVTPTMPTAYENSGYTPVVGTPYQAVHLLPADPDDIEMTGALYSEVGILQVSLFYPLGAGSAAASARAEIIRSTFYRGASFTSGDVTVTIRRTPAIYPAMTEEDRFMIPVRIPYFAHISRS